MGRNVKAGNVTPGMVHKSGGDPCRIRTCGPLLKRQVLYRLS